MAAFSITLVIFGAVNSFPVPLIEALVSRRSDPHEQGQILATNAGFLSISNALDPATAGLLVICGYGMPFGVTGVLMLMGAWFALGLRQSPAMSETSLPS